MYIYIYEHGISMKAVGSNPQDIPSTSTALGKKIAAISTSVVEPTNISSHTSRGGCHSMSPLY